MASAEAQKIIAEQKVVRIGDIAPDFDQESTKGPINWHTYTKDSWAILFSHPKAKTPICTTELAALSSRFPEFQAAGVKVAAVAVDSLEDNNAWVPDIANLAKTQDVPFPILCDSDYKIAKLYGMVNQEHIDAAGLPLTVRSVFFIAPDGKVGAIITYNANVGRNMDEILRVVDSLQIAYQAMKDGTPVACPVNWTKGSRIVVPPFVSTEKAKEDYQNVEIVQPYLRFADAPVKK